MKLIAFLKAHRRAQVIAALVAVVVILPCMLGVVVAIVDPDDKGDTNDARADPPRTAPTAETSDEAQETGEPSPATKEPEPDDDCIRVGKAMGRAIADGAEGVPMTPVEITAVRSPDFNEVYFIAMEFSSPGGDNEVGVWASGSVKPGESLLMAVDGFAQSFTTWPDADDSQANISPADPAVDAAKDCL